MVRNGEMNLKAPCHTPGAPSSKHGPHIKIAEFDIKQIEITEFDIEHIKIAEFDIKHI